MKKYSRALKTSLKPCWLKAALASLVLGAGIGAAYGQVQIAPVTNSFYIVPPNATNGLINGTNSGWLENFDGVPSQVGGFYLTNDAPTNVNGAYTGPWSNSMVVWTTYGPGGSNNWEIQINCNSINVSNYNALECDVKVDPGSALDEYNTSAYFQLGARVGAGQTYYNGYGGNLNPSTANNGWQHVIAPFSAMGGAAAFANLRYITIDPYDGNYTNAGTALIRVANIKLTTDLPSATFLNYTNATYQFNTASTVSDILYNWYGNANTVAWSANDSHTNNTQDLGPSSPTYLLWTNGTSGSLYISTTFASGNNNNVMVIPMDPNWGQYATEANPNDLIDLRQYTNIEFDIMWDTNNSTIPLGVWNAAGDINGFPMGIAENPGLTSAETQLGSNTKNVPNAASNGWVHMNIPIVKATSSDAGVYGLWLKKYEGTTGISGTAAYWIDNITFDGAVVPTGPNLPSLAISPVTPGLQANFHGTGGNPPYDREMMNTELNTYGFTDATGPCTYTITFGSVATNAAAGTSYGVLLWDPYPNGNGLNTEPDWNDPDIFRIVFQPTTYGTQIQLQAKTNTAAGNGDLYDASDPTWNATNVPTLGTWRITVTGNTNFSIVGPNGSSTNLPFPLSFPAAQVTSFFPSIGEGGGEFLYFGVQGNGAGCEGTRWVIGGLSVTNTDSTTPLVENFVADAAAGDPGPQATGLGAVWAAMDTGNGFTDTSDSRGLYGLYLLPPSTKYFIDYTDNAGGGFAIMTNSVLSSTGWATNTALTAGEYFNVNYYRTEAGTNALPSKGNLFFELDGP